MTEQELLYDLTGETDGALAIPAEPDPALARIEDARRALAEARRPAQRV